MSKKIVLKTPIEVINESQYIFQKEEKHSPFDELSINNYNKNDIEQILPLNQEIITDNYNKNDIEPILPLNQEITTDNYNKNDIKSILPLNQEITTNMDVEFGDFKKAPIKPTVYTLLEKIEELEKRIENLEKNK